MWDSDAVIDVDREERGRPIVANKYLLPEEIIAIHKDWESKTAKKYSIQDQEVLPE